MIGNRHSPLLGHSENTAGRMLAVHGKLLVQKADRARMASSFRAVHFARAGKESVWARFRMVV